jgi:16S rRNA (cytosine967-C5)-methyltransferase
VDERDSYANLVLPELLRERGISGRDAALATELVYGTLRGLGTYDAVLGACLDRAPEALDAPVLDVLRLGAHQVLATRIPPHAAVDTTVALARVRVGEGPAKLVNAVMRRVTAHDLDGWIDRIAPAGPTEPLDRLALQHSHPRWIARALLDALGGDLAELGRALAADNERPAVTLVARPGRATAAELLDAGARPARWSPYAAVLQGGDPAAIPAVRERRASVQDEGSQLVALAIAAAPIDGDDRRWLDLCAGPGGKAALLAGLATERNAELLAVERQPHRARMVENALRGGPGEHRVLVADGTEPPCSARRTVHRARRAAPTSRSQVAAPTVRHPGVARASGGPAACGSGRRPSRWAGGLRDLLAASGGDDDRRLRRPAWTSGRRTHRCPAVSPRRA